jgi:hypothetical protein
MAVNPIISIIYTKKNDGGQQSGTSQGVQKPQKVEKETSAVNHFNKKKVGISKFIGKSALNYGTMGKIMAGVQMANKGIQMTTQLAEAYSGDSISYQNLRNLSNAYANPFGFAKKAIWDYAIIRPMIVERQNEMLMYDRRLTGQMIYSEGKQRGIF